MFQRKKIVGLAILLTLGAAFFYRVRLRDTFDDLRKRSQVPPAEQFSEVKAESAPETPLKTSSVKPSLMPPPATQKNLAVPFTSQAPNSIWDAVHEETCEEASLLMVDAYYKKIKKITPATAEAGLLKLVDYQKKIFGFFEDTDAAQTARLLKDYFGYKNVAVTYNINIEDIKKELAAGRPVIVPAAGKLLGNPYFRGGGPDYHMLVIKGYTKDGFFITNDPGTRRGADYLYKFDKLYQAIDDWDSQKAALSGRKAMIVIMKPET